MCKDRKISLKTKGICPICKTPIKHLFWFRNGPTNHLKNKHICSNCGGLFYPVPNNKLEDGLKDRFELAEFLFEETNICVFNININPENIFSLKEQKYTQIDINDFSSSIFSLEHEVHALKVDFFGNKEKTKIFIPELNYKEFYLTSEFLSEVK